MLRRFFKLAAVAAVLAVLVRWWAVRDLPPDLVDARYFTVADRFLEVAGTRVRVRDEGAIDAPTIILLHGFADSLETWDGWAEGLRGDHRVIRYDLRGHGLTGADPDKRYRTEERVAFLGDVMDSLGVERASVAGAALGGLIAWRFAEAYPERVDRLVLAAPAAYPHGSVGEEPAPAPAWLKQAVVVFPKFAPWWWTWRRLTRISYADPEAAPASLTTRLSTMARRRGGARALVEHAMVFALPDPRDRLGGVRAPALIMWGLGDRVSPAEDALKMRRDLGGQADLVIYDDLGHFLHFEDPERTVGDARRFLTADREGDSGARDADAPAPSRAQE